jgi:hypothetical protein
MSVHTVFVRFFLGYSDTFPYDRVANLKDAEISPAMDQLREDWLKKPANRGELKRQRAEFKRQQAECMKRKLEWWGGGITRRSRKASIHASKPSVSSEPESDQPANFQPDMGWHKPCSLQAFPKGISSRYALTQFPSKPNAELACASLQQRVDELARAAIQKTPFEDNDTLLVETNPRFFSIEESQLLPAEQISVLAQIARLHKLESTNVTLEEVMLRVFLPELLPILKLVESQSGTNVESGPRVTLRGREEGPIVLGRVKPKLTKGQYDVVLALNEAGDAGLTKDDLARKSGHDDARGILTRLARKDDDWKQVIKLAGVTGGGYRIV